MWYFQSKLRCMWTWITTTLAKISGLTYGGMIMITFITTDMNIQSTHYKC